VQQDAAGRARSGKFNFRLEDGDAFFGLGEKTGALNKRNRTFKMFNRDALNYDAELSDPLYNSVPFFIKINGARSAACGLYFPNMRVDEVNFGVESRFYYYVSMGNGPFGYYLMTGKNYREVLSRYADLVGKPALPPLFSFGYLASSMGYTDPDDAEEKVLAYFDRVEKEKIPCEGMYFSSGYSKAGNGERYTFVWNRQKFPEPRKFLESLRARGYRICCNVKPGILSTHPWYAEIADRGAFIPDAAGEPYISYYWGNSASFVDFAHEAGISWWKDALTKNIIDQGVSGVWNDNNEFELEDESLAAQEYKSILPALMAKASYEALRKARPGKRPWVISRAGSAGLQRYARTWTGDNSSDFKTLRFNIAMGLNLGASGIPIYGHDIGGFVGPIPDEELLIRWCQSAVFQPRFVMHSWKSGGWITEPWSYPKAAPVIADLIRERYRFLPYIYNVAIDASETGVPMERALALEYPDDKLLSYDSLARMCGDSVLIPAPPERARAQINLRLPSGQDWYSPLGEKLERGGTEIEVAWPLNVNVYFFRCGSVIPTDPQGGSVRAHGFPELRFLLIPPTSFPCSPSSYREDDGESDFSEGSFWRYEFLFEKEEEGRTRFVATLKDRGSSFAWTKRLWRFSLPRGFKIESEDKIDHGSEIEYEFEDPPESFEFSIWGSYP